MCVNDKTSSKVWVYWCFEDLEEKGHLMNESVTQLFQASFLVCGGSVINGAYPV